MARQGQPQRQPAQVEEPSQPATMAIMARNEIEAQVDVARKYPRSIQTFKSRALSIATVTQDVAESCMYAIPRTDKDGNEVHIIGPSVRLAEICANAWGNLHSAGRIVEEGDKFITAEGVAWDLETNNKIVMSVARRITTSSGRRYGTDMIGVTGAAATAIAHRNAVFKVIPRAFVDELFDKVRETAVGDAKTLSTRRTELFQRLLKLGVHEERIFARLGKTSIQDVTLDDVALLIGLGTSIKEGVSQIDEAFPPPAAASQPVPPEGGEGRVSVVNAGNAPPPVQSSQPAQGAQPAPPPANVAPTGPDTSQGQRQPAQGTGDAHPQDTTEDPGDLPDLPPDVPAVDPEDQKIVDACDAAKSNADLRPLGSQIRTLKDRIGNARYKLLFDAYNRANTRINPKPAK